MQREIIRRASARRNAFTVRQMASKLFAELDDTKLGAVRRAMKGLVAMGFLIHDKEAYRRTRKAISSRPEWTTSLEIVQIDWDEADKMLDGNHYLGAAGWKRGYCLSTPTRDALAVFGPPVAAHFKEALPNPLELTRLWHSPDAPFWLSQFVARSLRWIRKEAPETDCVFSYADPGAVNPETGKAHVGGIYTASNFAFIGTSHRTGYWLDESGERVSLPVCYRRFKTKSAPKIAALNPTWQFCPGERKNLYVYPMRLKLPAVLEAIGGEGKRYNEVQYSPQWQVKIKDDLGDLW